VDPLLVKQWRVASLIAATLALLVAYVALPLGVVGMTLFGLNTLFGLLFASDMVLSIFNKGWLGRVPGPGFFMRRAVVGAVGWIGFGLSGAYSSSMTSDVISLDGAEVIIVTVMCGVFGAFTQPLFITVFSSRLPRQKRLLRAQLAWLRRR